MKNLKRINETSEGVVTLNGVVVFAGEIEKESDILFECSCICVTPISTKGSIRAQYDLNVVGSVRADAIHIGGKFDCSGDVTCSSIEVIKTCTIDGNLSAEEVSIRGTLICDELGCENLSAKEQVVIRSTADVSGNLSVERALICLDGITVDGDVSAENIVVGDYADLDGRAFVLSEMGEEPLQQKKEPRIERQDNVNIADASIDTLKDFESPLATVLDDVAAFIENCQDSFAKGDYEAEKDVLKTLSSFLPSFTTLYHCVKDALDVVEMAEIGEWYSDFFSLANAFLHTPDWMRDSQIDKRITARLDKHIQLFTKSNYALQSRSVWGRCLSTMQQLKVNEHTTKVMGDNLDLCISTLYNKIGVKSRFVKLYLPEA